VQHRVRPDVVGEFEDNALLNTFGRRGLGLFFAPAALETDIEEQFGAVLVGRCRSVREQFYAISNERKIKHPAVEAILSAVHKGMPGARRCRTVQCFRLCLLINLAPFCMQNVLFVVLALFLVALNGFFVAAEFGIVTLRKTRVRAIAKTGGLRGRILYKVHSQLDAYLSACQLGITLASLGLGWVGEPAFASLLEPAVRLLGVTSPNDPRRVLRDRLRRDLLPAHRGRRAGAKVAGDPHAGSGRPVERAAAVRLLLGDVSGDLGAQRQRQHGAARGRPVRRRRPRPTIRTTS
jgi:hypothetical protein